jgi:hypothetical protein
MNQDDLTSPDAVLQGAAETARSIVNAAAEAEVDILLADAHVAARIVRETAVKAAAVVASAARIAAAAVAKTKASGQTDPSAVDEAAIIAAALVAAAAEAAAAMVADDRSAASDIVRRTAFRAAVTILEGILPICSFCKKIRTVDGRWEQLESYISAHSEAQFSHGLCEPCARKHYPEMRADEPR